MKEEEEPKESNLVSFMKVIAGLVAVGYMIYVFTR